MQTRIRKTTCSRGNEGLSKRNARICTAIASFALIFTLSCSTFQKPYQKNLKKNLDKICFSAEGSGRVGFSSKRYAFEFESLISREKKKWSLAFHFPAIGEKLVEVDYIKDLKNQNKSFKNLLKDLNQEEFNDFILGEFWQKMSAILMASDGMDKSLTWGISKDRFIISFPPRRDYQFIFEASALESFYRRIKISIGRDRDMGLRGPALEIELFLDNCGVKQG